jgi:muramoyltetrapeptide carboxypeptidase
MASSLTFGAQTIIEKIPLGDDFVTIETYQSKNNGLTFFHLHEDEVSSYTQSKKIVDEYGGKLISIKQSGKRLIEFSLDNQTYIVDPNRIFTDKGIKDSLEKYSKYNAKALDEIRSFANRVASIVIGKLVIAVHNNYNKGYNIETYKNNTKEVKSFYQNPKQGTGEFFYTTDDNFFNFAKVAGYNVVLQSDGVINDGSFSVYAALQGSDYVNLEVQRGKDSLELEMLSFLLRYFTYTFNNTKPPKKWQALKKGDTIDLIAPSSATNPASVKQTIKALENFGFKVSTKYAKSQPTKLYYDNTDEYRANAFIGAMNDPDSKAVWAIKGGAGATRLLEKILKYSPPKITKPLIGFSDITALHNFVNSKWNIPSLHAIVADYNSEVDKVIGANVNSKESLKTVVDILLAKNDKLITYTGLSPMNTRAKEIKNIDTSLLGGNLTLIQSSIGTPFQPNLENKVLILEDIGNSAHQLERILDNVRYSNLLTGVKAIILGEFIYTSHDTKQVTDMVDLVLQRFANALDIAVFRADFFGHSSINHPIPLNTNANINKQGQNFLLNINIK